MEWTNAKTLLLIEQYKSKPALWNRSDENYKNKTLRSECWMEMADKLNATVFEIKKKMNSLLTSFRRERQREIEKLASGEKYVSNFVAFMHLDFLKNKGQVATNKINEDTTAIIEDDDNVDNIYSIKEKPEISRMEKEHRNYSIKRNTHKRKFPENQMISKVYNMLQETTCARLETNGDSLFGQYITAKLSRYSQHTKNKVQHLISNLLFDADMGKYEPASTSSQPVSVSFPLASGTLSFKRIQRR